MTKPITSQKTGNESSGEWIELESSFLDAALYNKDTRKLQIRINSKIYDYEHVPENIYEGLITSSSPGKYYDEHIKGKYSDQKIERPTYKPFRTEGQRGNVHDSAFKDVLGTAWGAAELALLFAPLPMSVPAKVATMAASIIGGGYLTAHGIEPPPALETVIDLGVGYSLFTGLRGIGSRASQYYGSIRTPYFDIGMKKGVATAKVSPAQTTAGILFGANKWKQTLVGIEKRKAFMNYLESYKVPGTDGYDITNDEIKMLKNFTEFNLSRRKSQGAEKALDLIIRNQKYIPSVVAGTYVGMSAIQDIGKLREDKKKKKKKKKSGVSFSKTGVSVATTILDIGRKA